MYWLVLLVAAAGAGTYLFTRRFTLDPRWQPGSLLFGWEPDIGEVEYLVQSIEWRDRRVFETDRTEYKPQWWYEIDGAWYPEQYLEFYVAY